MAFFVLFYSSIKIIFVILILCGQIQLTDEANLNSKLFELPYFGDNFYSYAVTLLWGSVYNNTNTIGTNITRTNNGIIEAIQNVYLKIEIIFILFIIYFFTIAIMRNIF